MTREVKVTVLTNPRWRPLRSVYATAFQIGVIGIGVAANSPAMQWSGFIVLMLIAVGMAVAGVRKNEGLSIAEAIRRLNEIEADEVRK